MSQQPERKRRSGSVKRQANGRFVAKVTITNQDGRRSSLSKTFLDSKLAQKWVSDMEVKKAEGAKLGVKWSRQPLGEWIHEFYTKYRIGPKQRLISLRTCQADLEIVDTYLIRKNPRLAETPLSKLTADDIASHFRALAESGRADGTPLARATVERLFRILRARLAFAVKLKRIKESPISTDLIPVDGKAKRKQRTFTEEQSRAFLAVASRDKHGAFFATMLWTGARPGEVAGLTWADVDLAAAKITICRALVRVKGLPGQAPGKNFTLAQTKTGKERAVPISSELVRILKAHSATQAAHRLQAGEEFEDHKLVFPSDFGRPLHLDTLAARHFKPLLPQAAAYLLNRELPSLPAPSRSKAYEEAKRIRARAEAQAMADADFPNLSLYGCRHTMATLLLRRGTHLKIVSDRLGHSKLSTTGDIYSHAEPDIQAQAVVALEDALNARPRLTG